MTISFLLEKFHLRLHRGNRCANTARFADNSVGVYNKHVKTDAYNLQGQIVWRLYQKTAFWEQSGVKPADPLSSA